MKKKEKTVCQIIRFRGKIEAFLVSIDEFGISEYTCIVCLHIFTYRVIQSYHYLPPPTSLDP